MNNPLIFYKYHGAGNDFVLIDNRVSLPFDFNNPDFIHHLCHRNFGIGSDGLILLEKDNNSDFKMRYFNADGNEGSMCGNGGRCIVAFANDLNIIKNEGSFNAADGFHKYKILGNNEYAISLKEVTKVEIMPNGFFINTGSPHWVEFVDDLNRFDVSFHGKKIRWDPTFSPGGTNVNFISESSFGLEVATFERGVEAETLACGTGVAASAIAYYLNKGWQVDEFELSVKTKGGVLQVGFKPIHEKNGVTFNEVWLSGPTKFVFKGEIFLDASIK